jgi:hypothetical protein
LTDQSINNSQVIRREGSTVLISEPGTARFLTQFMNLPHAKLVPTTSIIIIIHLKNFYSTTKNLPSTFCNDFCLRPKKPKNNYRYLVDITEMWNYTVFQKKLYNFESLYKCIQRTCTVFWTVIMWQKTPNLIWDSYG